MTSRRLSAFLLALCAWCSSRVDTVARDLTFEQRVAAQETIERVYHAHQIGDTRSFEEAVPRYVLEAKVNAYLKQTVALEEVWATRVTAEMLQQEMTRMQAGSRLPGRLNELREALGNDTFLFQETVARAALVDRLTRHFYAFDRRIHAAARLAAENMRETLGAGCAQTTITNNGPALVAVSRAADDPVAGRDPVGPRPSQRPESDTVRMRVVSEEFQRIAESVPDALGTVGPLLEEPAGFVYRIGFQKTSNDLLYAVCGVPKQSWDEWWGEVEPLLDVSAVTPVADEGIGWPAVRAADGASSEFCVNDTWNNGALGAVPDPRGNHTTVWTGSLMIIWGGYDGNELATGGRYDPLTDTWTPTTMLNAPTARFGHVAVWTGSRMLIWGGSNVNGGVAQGARYDPVADAWTAMSTSNAPSAGSGATAVWTGSVMIVWGGGTNAGGRYNPATNTWQRTSLTNAPSRRSTHTAVWSGDRMIVWGGVGFDPSTGSLVPLNTGGIYDLASDSWVGTTTDGAPQARQDHTAIWSGDRMIVWGGRAGNSFFGTGAAFQPSSNTWVPLSAAGAPAARSNHVGVWTGTWMVIWGGANDTSGLNTGGRYDPAEDSWTPTSVTDAPQMQSGQDAVFTGSLMVIWGGTVPGGGRYDPVTDRWTPVDSGPPDVIDQQAVWTGSRMLIWGMTSTPPYVDEGAGYDPALDTFSILSTDGAPPPRGEHTAVWTGREMLIWGGVYFGDYLNSGGRYDPIADSWTPIGLGDAPSGRRAHTAVWTGLAMVIWGGDSFDDATGIESSLDTGGIYNPETNAWRPTSMTNAPNGRFLHTAVWTGTQMIVWGGARGSSYQPLGDGGVYDPEGDIWSPTAALNAPSPRLAHTAVWGDGLMIVWGGVGPVGTSSNFLDTGARYDPLQDRWTPTSRVGGGPGRSEHSAVWAGTQMLVWGGRPSTATASGRRYDPSTDSWSLMSALNSPLPRVVHQAIWTGSVMVISGGTDSSLPLFSGGRYCTCTGSIGTVYRDADGDGYGDPTTSIEPCGAFQPGYVPVSGDCNDSDAAIHPDSAEMCDGIDQDCNGQVDEGFGVGVPCEEPLDTCHDVVGTTQCRADGGGTSCQGVSTLHDTQPPTLVVTASPNSLWPPNHQMIPVRFDWQVTDACDPAPTVTLVSVTSSEPDDQAGYEDGDTTNDVSGVALGTSGNEVDLRAERSGAGTGRVYQVTYAARDASGNASSSTATVTVPHDQSTDPETLLLRVEMVGATGQVRLTWPTLPGALAYDVISGDLRAWRLDHKTLWLGTVKVLARANQAKMITESPIEPLLGTGEARFYLIQARSSTGGSGYGTESAPWPRIPTQCDGGCP